MHAKCMDAHVYILYFPFFVVHFCCDRFLRYSVQYFVCIYYINILCLIQNLCHAFGNGSFSAFASTDSNSSKYSYIVCHFSLAQDAHLYDKCLFGQAVYSYGNVCDCLLYGLLFSCRQINGTNAKFHHHHRCTHIHAPFERNGKEKILYKRPTKWNIYALVRFHRID